MFERNRIDNASSGSVQVTAVPAEVTLDDGDVLFGHFVVPSTRSFSETLNGPQLFIEFEPFEKPRQFLAKSALRAIKLMNAPPAETLDSRRMLPGEFDPYQTLGVRRDAEWDDIRAAYLRLAKTYHADRFASVDMPAEVRVYLREMSTRINTAYAALEEPRLKARKVTMRPAPVYESAPRY